MNEQRTMRTEEDKSPAVRRKVREERKKKRLRSGPFKFEESGQRSANGAEN